MWRCFTEPWSGIRLFFALVTLLPGLVLVAVQTAPVRQRLSGHVWGESPATVRLRQAIHFFLSWALGMVGVAICLGDTTNPIHSIIYFAVALIHAGKVLRLAHYDR